VLLSEVPELDDVAVDPPSIARELAKRFWPGALTLVLKRAPHIPALVSGGRDTIGVRVPDHSVPRALVRGLGRPITGTSANSTGHPGATSAAEVKGLLGEKVDYVIDGGGCQGSKASTVLDLTGSTPRVLREGGVAIADIQPFFTIPLKVG
jgi:L-threonylcarbamoyladenylate synthase